MTTAWIGVGANLGDARQAVRQALDELAATPGIDACTPSPCYRTAPVDAAGPPFVNAVARIDTSLPPLDLLDALQAIERAHGRLRPYRNAPRTLDLDLLMYGDVAMDTPRLVLPHPRMHQRAFVLRPLLDLQPDARLAQGSVADLLAACAGQAVERLD